MASFTDMAPEAGAAVPRWQAPSPEASLLLDLVLRRPVERATAAIDWARFARLALRHRVAPMAAARLGSAGLEAPEAVQTAFAAFALASERRNAVLVGELVLLGRRLDAAGIPYASLKGPILAELADGRQGLRTLADLDLLVTHDDAETVIALLQNRGYAHVLKFQENGKDDSLVRTGDHLLIELHRRLYINEALPIDVTLESCIDRLGAASLAGQTIKTLPPQENLLYLSLHGARHGWSRLTWLSGFLAAAEQTATGPDLAGLSARADSLGLVKTMALPLAMARLAGAPSSSLAWPQFSGQAAWADSLLVEALSEPLDLPAGTQAASNLLLTAAEALSPPDGSGRPRGLAAIETHLPPPQDLRGLRKIRYTAALGGSVRRQIAHSLFTPYRDQTRARSQSRQADWLKAALAPFRRVRSRQDSGPRDAG